MATLSGHRSAVRVAATAAALAAAALTVGAGPVSAAPDTPTVEFTGGSVLSLLVCKSQPNMGDLSVPADSHVNFVNRLGQDAKLKVDGENVATVQPNQQVPVLFKKGPVEVAMTFDCGVGVVQQFKPVSVGVTAPPADDDQGPAPAPAATGQAARGGNGNGTSSGDGSGNGNGNGNGAGQGAPAGPAGAAAGAANHALSTGTAKAKATKSASAGAAAEDPASEQGTEPANPSQLDPSAAAAAAVGATPSTSVEDRVTVEEPVAASGPARSGPAGLLALVATVCAVGVGIAAIRAIIAQRASRASFA